MLIDLKLHKFFFSYQEQTCQRRCQATYTFVLKRHWILLKRVEQAQQSGHCLITVNKERSYRRSHVYRSICEYAQTDPHIDIDSQYLLYGRLVLHHRNKHIYRSSPQMPTLPSATLPSKQTQQEIQMQV